MRYGVDCSLRNTEKFDNSPLERFCHVQCGECSSASDRHGMSSFSNQPMQVVVKCNSRRCPRHPHFPTHIDGLSVKAMILWNPFSAPLKNARTSGTLRHRVSILYTAGTEHVICVSRLFVTIFAVFLVMGADHLHHPGEGCCLLHNHMPSWLRPTHLSGLT